MGLFSRLFPKTNQKAVNGNPFSFLLGHTAPDMKTTDYLDAYSGWVYACTNAITEEVGVMDLKLQRKGRDGWTDVDDHIALGPLHSVNPFMSSDELKLATQAYLELSGDAFWWMPYGRAVRKPLEIWLLDPARTTVVRHQTKFIGGYVYKNEKGQDIPLPVEEVLHFKRFNPRNRYRGIGTVQAAALSIDIDTYAAKWNRNFFFNSAMPSAVLEAEGTITQEQYDRIRANWMARYQGVDNAHKLAITEGGLKYKPISLSQKDRDFLETRRYSRDEIMGIFRVPKSVLGITEDVNRANAEATDYVFAKRVTAPRMRFLATTLTEFYLPMFGLASSEYRLIHSDPVPQNVESSLRAKEVALNTGYKTRNEIREEDGLTPQPDGDVLLVPGTLKPIDLVLNPPEPPMTPGATPADGDKTPPKKTLAKDAAANQVAGRIAFVIRQIKQRTAQYKRILADQREQLVTRLAGAEGQKAFVVVKEDTSPERADELVRFLFEDWNDWIGILLHLTRDALEASYAEAGKQAITQLDIDLTFDLEHARAISWLETNALNHATAIADTIRDEVKRLIVQGVKDGLGADDIAESIGAFFDAQSQWRALRIARTEVIAGYAEGSLEGYRQSGIVKTKRWITAGDARVEVECQLNEEQGPIPLDLPFASGHLAPVVHQNCRCVLASGD